MSEQDESSIYAVGKLIAEARKLAADYRRATGKSLPGVSGEVAEFDAARLLDLELIPDATGYDAIGRGAREGRKIQIKARVIFNPGKGGYRIGQLKLEQDWDTVVLVLMDENFEPFEIHEADREDILEALDEGVSDSRSRRGAMSVSRFKNIGRLAWDVDDGEITDEIWENR